MAAAISLSSYPASDRQYANCYRTVHGPHTHLIASLGEQAHELVVHRVLLGVRGRGAHHSRHA